MFVRYWMVQPVFTTTPEVTLLAAMGVLQQHGCRRLPVIKNDRLVGIISKSDLYRFLPPEESDRVALPMATEQALMRATVADVMHKNVVTCAPSTTLEDVGVLMCNHRIGALPVVDQNKVVGIITETTYLRAMSKLSHIGEGRRVCFRISLADKMKVFYGIIGRCQSYNLEILSVTTQSLDNDPHSLVFLRVRGDNVSAFIDSLWKSHFDVLLADGAS